jgi:HK97 family phage prohead protease
LEGKSTVSKVETRFVCQESAKFRIETREDGKRVLSGYGIVFHDPANPGTEYRMAGEWFERIDPTAADESLADPAKDITSTFNHTRDLILGRRSSGTLKLSKDATGIRYEVELPDTSAGRDVAALVERGDIRGSSFTFRELAYEQDRSNDKHKVWNVRKLELIEIGPVTEPAYTATTTGFRMSEDRAAKLAEIETQERANEAAAERRRRVASLL